MLLSNGVHFFFSVADAVKYTTDVMKGLATLKPAINEGEDFDRTLSKITTDYSKCPRCGK